MQKLLSELTAAHLNALNSTMGSVETQLAALKTVIAGLKSTPTDDVAPTAKASKKAKAAAADEVEDTDLGDDEISDDGADAEPEHTKKDVIKALQDYAAENDRPAAMKVLKKFGVKSVHDLDVSKYGKIIAALEI
jgi:hypothetical protein